MPYIPKEDRADLAPRFARAPRTQGELNYQLTCVAQHYVRVHGLSYGTLNTVVGALECAKAEFQRRVVAPYEDSKLKQNGDVYDSF